MTRPVILFILFVAGLYSQPVSVVYWGLSDTIPPGAAVSADSVFRYAESISDIIDYDDCNICKSRAHILARALEKRFPNAKIAKLWLIAECKTSSNKERYKYKEHKLLRYNNECKNWVYHVAPLVITPIDTFVIDPATQKGPIGVYHWMHDLIRPEGSAISIVKDMKYFVFPDDADDNFEDKKADWNDSDEPVTDDDFSRAIDEVTRAKLGLIEPWKMQEHVKKLKEMVK